MYVGGQQLHYPSPAEVKIFIGTHWVDDVYRVDYTVSTPRTPLYDYTSRFYKEVAEGHTIVQGQLVINFRFPGYLLHAMRGDLTRDPSVAKSLSEASDMFYDLAQGTAKEKVQKLMEMKRLGALKHAKQAAETLYGDTNYAYKDGKVVGGAYDTQANPVPSQRDIISFNIDIGYGGEEAIHNHSIRDCVLVGEAQVISAAALAGGDLSASSMPIYEIYSFFGKRVESRVTRRGARYVSDNGRDPGDPDIKQYI